MGSAGITVTRENPEGAAASVDKAAPFQCIVQGCTGHVEQLGDVCAECRTVFAGYITYNANGQRPTSDDIAAADDRLRRAHEQQATTENGATQHSAELRRRNQRCWLCTNRRTCTKKEGGWECNSCLEIR